MEQGKIIGIIVPLRGDHIFPYAHCLFSGNTKSKPHDPGNAVYETAVKWYNDVT